MPLTPGANARNVPRMGIDLNLRGRRPADLAVDVVRPLVETDMAALSVDRAISAPSITEIRSRHHALARALASGMSEGEAAIVSGYSQSRVSILKADPAFQELYRFYKNRADAEYVALHATLANVAQDAVEEIRKRLEETPDEVTTGQLVEIAKMGADRTGHGPQTSQTVNVNIGLADRLAEARKRAASRLIEGDVVDAG